MNNKVFHVDIQRGLSGVFLYSDPDNAAVTASGLNVYNPAGSTSSSTSDHWLVRLAGGSERGSVALGEPDLGPLIIEAPDSIELPVFGDETPKATATSRYPWFYIVVYCATYGSL